MIKPPIRTIIVDDEPAAIANLMTLLQNHPEIKVIETISDANLAVDAVLAKNPDLLFLDIQMPGKTGFDIAKALLDAADPPAIIFATGFDKFAIEAIRHAAFDFLVKPVDPDELNLAIERLQQAPSKPSQVEQFTRLIERTLLKPKIKISNTGGFSMISPSDIIYIQADWNYSELFFSQGKSELATMNIGSLEESLPKNDFFRISRSIIINVTYLTKVSRKKREATLLKDGQEFRFAIPLLNIRKLERFLE
ncbi:MAG: LytTR family DNA-binding domain-containing protein [Bacteroidota bacterium]